MRRNRTDTAKTGGQDNIAPYFVHDVKMACSEKIGQGINFSIKRSIKIQASLYFLRGGT